MVLYIIMSFFLLSTSNTQGTVQRMLCVREELRCKLKIQMALLSIQNSPLVGSVPTNILCLCTNDVFYTSRDGTRGGLEG